MSRVDVRPATAADWETVKQVRLRALRDAPTAFASTYAREAAFADDEWRSRAGAGNSYLAWLDGNAVGMAVGLDDPDQRPDTRELVAMWVDPVARGRGVAAALVDAVVGAARVDGVRYVGLWVVDDNARARRLYERCGFTLTGDTTPLPHDPSRLEQRMTLRL